MTPCICLLVFPILGPGVSPVSSPLLCTQVKLLIFQSVQLFYLLLGQTEWQLPSFLYARSGTRSHYKHFKFIFEVISKKNTSFKVLLPNYVLQAINLIKFITLLINLNNLTILPLLLFFLVVRIPLSDC